MILIKSEHPHVIHNAAPILTTILVFAAGRVNDGPFYVANASCSIFCAWASCRLLAAQTLKPATAGMVPACRNIARNRMLPVRVLPTAAGPLGPPQPLVA